MRPRNAPVPYSTGVPPSTRSFPFVLVKRIQSSRRFVAKRLMWSLIIVKMEVRAQGYGQRGAILKVAGIDQFVLQAAPQPFDKNVVQGSATAIHADGDLALLQRSAATQNAVSSVDDSSQAST